MRKFSVIVLLYNSDPYKIRMTLESVLQQDFTDYEIIVSDDGSKEDPFEQIEEYFREKQFSEYIIVKNDVNVGTVRNIYGALKRSQGAYIKILGAGDMLYGRNTLREVYDFMTINQYKSCFGRMKSFSLTDDYRLVHEKYHSPKYLKEYTRKKIKRNSIVRDLLHQGNWVFGATMFFERSRLFLCMKHLLGKVVYTEDVVQIMLFLKKDHIRYFDRYVVWYEVGHGISTSGNAKFTKAIRKDQESFISYIGDKCKGNKKLNCYIEERRNQKAGIQNISFKQYLEGRRWAFCVWLEKTFEHYADGYGFFDSPGKERW